MSSGTKNPAQQNSPQPAGLIQQLEAILGTRLSQEARKACEVMMIGVLHVGMQAASYTAEAARERHAEISDAASKKAAELIGEVTV